MMKQMIFYKRNIEKVAVMKSKLSLIESAMLDNLLDYYASSGVPISKEFEECRRIAKAKRSHEQKSLKYVLKQCFFETVRGYENIMMNEILLEYQTKQTNKQAGKRANDPQRPVELQKIKLILGGGK